MEKGRYFIMCTQSAIFLNIYYSNDKQIGVEINQSLGKLKTQYAIGNISELKIKIKTIGTYNRL